jgi:hypothetical protein
MGGVHTFQFSKLSKLCQWTKEICMEEPFCKIEGSRDTQGITGLSREKKMDGDDFCVLFVTLSIIF